MNAPLVIGLTGSIGMGKSTTAQLFAELGIPVWDADASVAQLYRAQGAGARALSAIVPQAVGQDGVDRTHLKRLIQQDPTLLPRIEKIIHPLVEQDRADFIAQHSDADLVVLDIPLLLEKGRASDFDKVIVVSARQDVQKSRVMARGTMDEATFEMILKKQMPDAQKREKADFIVETTTIDHAREQVQTIVNELRRG